MTGHSPEHIRGDNDNSYMNRIIPLYPNVTVTHTSTSGECGTVSNSSVTVWMKVSIFCFLRSLKVTSFSSSSICYCWQRLKIFQRNIWKWEWSLFTLGNLIKTKASPAFWAGCSETGFLPPSAGLAPLLSAVCTDHFGTASQGDRLPPLQLCFFWH